MQNSCTTLQTGEWHSDGHSILRNPPLIFVVDVHHEARNMLVWKEHKADRSDKVCSANAAFRAHYY